jgi:hypothetical protein
LKAVFAAAFFTQQKTRIFHLLESCRNELFGPSQDLGRGDLGQCSLQEALPKGKMGQLVLLLKGGQATVVVLQVANPAA